MAEVMTDRERFDALTTEQQIAFAMYGVGSVMRWEYKEWGEWAEDWLSGRDRSSDSAWRVRRVGREWSRSMTTTPQSEFGRNVTMAAGPAIAAAGNVVHSVAHWTDQGDEPGPWLWSAVECAMGSTLWNETAIEDAFARVAVAARTAQ